MHFDPRLPLPRIDGHAIEDYGWIDDHVALLRRDFLISDLLGLIGTDWRVLNIGCTYAQGQSLVEACVAPILGTEEPDILGGTAARVYCWQAPLTTRPKLAAGVPHREHA